MISAPENMTHHCPGHNVTESRVGDTIWLECDCGAEWQADSLMVDLLRDKHERVITMELDEHVQKAETERAQAERDRVFNLPDYDQPKSVMRSGRSVVGGYGLSPLDPDIPAAYEMERIVRMEIVEETVL
jgi:hypothetical protein